MEYVFMLAMALFAMAMDSAFSAGYRRREEDEYRERQEKSRKKLIAE
jgi:hypothetical protein